MPEEDVSLTDTLAAVGTIHEDKYVVFKAEEWGDYVRNLGYDNERAIPARVDDAVVIRRQDVFAPPALDTYANTIATCAEVLRQNGQPLTADRMQAISDYFHEQAVLSWETDRKVPD